MSYRLACLGLIFAFMSVASAQSTISALKDPTALALAQSSLIAMGGGSNFLDVRASGTTTVHGDNSSPSYPIMIMATGKASVTTTIQKPSGPRVYVTDGTAACINGALAKSVADTQYDLYARRIDFIPALSIL